MTTPASNRFPRPTKRQRRALALLPVRAGSVEALSIDYGRPAFAGLARFDGVAWVQVTERPAHTCMYARYKALNKEHRGAVYAARHGRVT